MSTYINPFTSVHVPLLWLHVLAEFGRAVEYWPAHESAQAFTVTGVWKEGAEGETVSPGRYSSFWISNAELSALPSKGDAIQKDGIVYDVVDVDATPYGYSRLTLQEGAA